QNDVTLKMPAFEWVHVQLHQQKGMISLSPPTICNSALSSPLSVAVAPEFAYYQGYLPVKQTGKAYVKVEYRLFFKGGAG
ncbi:hypothetical protein ACWJQD_28155, partial [Klebsiella pneumoniae]